MQKGFNLLFKIAATKPPRQKVRHGLTAKGKRVAVLRLRKVARTTRGGLVPARLPEAAAKARATS